MSAVSTKAPQKLRLWQLSPQTRIAVKNPQKRLRVTFSGRVEVVPQQDHSAIATTVCNKSDRATQGWSGIAKTRVPEKRQRSSAKSKRMGKGQSGKRKKIYKRDLTRDNPEIIRPNGGWKVWTVCVLYTFVVVMLTHTPLEVVGAEDVMQVAKVFWLDKVVHFALFSGLTAVYACGLFPFCRDPMLTLEYVPLRRVVFLAVFILTFAVVSEYTQPYFNRSFDYMDLTANILAIIPGSVLFLMLNEIRFMLYDQSQ